MRNFRTIHNFVTTSGKTVDRVRGYFCSLEHAEMCGERLRVGTEYTIWKRMDGGWFVYRTREAS
jgi:hypothetical protein